MRGKIFTVDEANRMLPLVARIADDIVASYQDVNRALESYEGEKARSAIRTDKDRPERESELQRRDAEVAEALERFQRLLQEMEALGGTVKDYERGSVDFYGEVDGEIVYLCWSRGEPSLGYWHRLEDGYSKRRALPVTAAA